ncbi:CHAT domain-containing protein [Undibacterium sp. TC4M20W]|uniref:CHAT domain-containing protein n=1 Tax=Undibacterium sp. TC4M20W TaxID=3413052 RepID=UPI003BF35A71
MPNPQANLEAFYQNLFLGASMRLRYVLVVPEDESDATVIPFQGWNSVMLDRRFHHLLYLLSCLPSAAIEIFMSHDELLSFRRQGTFKDVIAIGDRSLDKIVLIEEGQIGIFICLPSQIEKIKCTQVSKKTLALILSPKKEKGVVDVGNLKLPFSHSIDKQILELLLTGKTAKQKIRKIRKPYSSAIEIPMQHGIVSPNQVLLESLGYSVTGPDGVVLENHEDAVNAVTKTAQLTLDILFSSDESMREIIVYSPSVKVFFYDFKQNFWNQLLRGVKEKWKKKIIEEGLFRNKSYSFSSLSLDGESITNPYKDPVIGPILAARQSELFATSSAIALLSNVQSIPSVRLPNAINLHLSKLRNIESLTKRTDPKGMSLLQKTFYEYVTVLKSEIGEGIATLICQQSQACKFCSDVPLEWLYLGKVPLMISHEVSRLPMTPGNLLLQYAASGAPRIIPSAVLQQVLVIRSFRNNDPIRDFLETAIAGYPLSERMKITIIDVDSKMAAIKALNEFEGAIVIFDCHGDHGGHELEGWLQFGNDRTNTWELAHVAGVPPIVMLSACSTSAIGGSHISVANGFLRSGALSVIGTFLPVSGAKSAIFIARILYRIDAFLPSIASHGFKTVSWRTVITGMLRMSYITDVLDHFYTEKLFNREQWMKIHLEANNGINSLSSDWYEAAIGHVSQITGITIERLFEKITNENPLMETMRYCQLGMPEHIKIFLQD